MEVDPNGRDPTAPLSDRKCFAWASFRSKTTHVEGNNSRSIVWAPGHLYEKARRIYVSWWWQPVRGSLPGRLLNLHTHPKFGGWTQPENPNGVSPIALDYFGPRVYDGADGLMLVLEPHAKGGRPYHFQLASFAEVQAAQANRRPFSIALEIDIADEFIGKARGFVNGREAFSLSGLRTVFPGQTGVALWEGSYNSTGVPDMQANEYAPARIGRSSDECLADGTDWPIEEDSTWGSVSRSNGLPAHRHIALGTIDTSTIIVPEAWGSDPPPPPPEPVVITSTVENGDAVEHGALWQVQATPPAEKVEFWADGAKFDEDTSEPFSTTVELAKGPHKLGLAVTVDGERQVLGSGGIYATVIVTEPAPDPEPVMLQIREVSRTEAAITLAWEPVEDAIGFRFSREKSGGKFSHTWDGNRVTARFANDSAWYEVEALGSVVKGVYRP
jgi:hypothetical protein